MTYLLAIATGLLLWLCYPPFNLGWLVWIALLPLLWALWRGKTAGEPPERGGPRSSPETGGLLRWTKASTMVGAFLHGYVGGAVFFLLSLQWLRLVTFGGMVMLALYLALYPAVWAVFAATVGRPRKNGSGWELLRAVFVTAAAWTGLEWLRSVALTGFGWNGLGVAFAFRNNNIAQYAEYVGVMGLSLVPAAFAAFLAIVCLARPQPSSPSEKAGGIKRWKIMTFVTICFGLHLPPHFITIRDRAEANSFSPGNTSIALVQPNIPQAYKNIPEAFDDIAQTLADLTQEAFVSEPKPQLVVWPESSLPAPFTYPEVQDLLSQGKQLGDFTHILGIDEQLLDRFYNSIAVVHHGDPAKATLHQKVHLVPFGEYLPARGLFGRFDFIREQLPGDFDAGASDKPLPISVPQPFPEANPPLHVSAIPLVCFEDTIGRVARRFARPEPQIIVNVTNDAWYDGSEGSEQHLANAVFRAIELRRPMLRSANSGVTALIDPLGRVVARLPKEQPGVLKTTLALPTDGTLTFYARYGDVFSITLFAISIFACGEHWLRQRRQKRCH